ncbi:GNAT family N-acetyltransferase [Natronoglycomyces albus]|uniref:GNAT family N-acetyltransferase n=1 Tax=Natronoglycomyces albus TaxID=2811108 RepID=A0A895XSX0_9ACTN|nr:GNAT family N-acetyltransferase [Natronoglycomyces albus]QSB06593.1 GNAT family N-acetyltransferase [Natronoglycomyces albus]
MQIKKIDVHDSAAVAKLYELTEAVHSFDHPDISVRSLRDMTNKWRHPWPGEDGEIWVAISDGRFVGKLELGWPTRENLHFFEFSIEVHPDYRRQGIGTALYDLVEKNASARGRTELVTSTKAQIDGGAPRPGTAAEFLKRLGYKLALTEVTRECAVDTLSRAEEQELYDKALPHASDYDIVSWIGSAPEKLVPSISDLESKILLEVPLGDVDLEAETIDVARFLELEESYRKWEFAQVQTVAVHRDTNTVAANTLFAVPVEPADFAFQMITIVDPAHRGHRLGILCKIANLWQMREHIPRVKKIYTGNADVNSQMISINEQLGYFTVDNDLAFKKVIAQASDTQLSFHQHRYCRAGRKTPARHSHFLTANTVRTTAPAQLQSVPPTASQHRDPPRFPSYESSCRDRDGHVIGVTTHSCPQGCIGEATHQLTLVFVRLSQREGARRKSRGAFRPFSPSVHGECRNPRCVQSMFTRKA